MKNEVLTEGHKKYAKECLEAIKNSPKVNISIEEMRAQVQQNCEKVMRKSKLR